MMCMKYREMKYRKILKSVMNIFLRFVVVVIKVIIILNPRLTATSHDDVTTVGTISQRNMKWRTPQYAKPYRVDDVTFPTRVVCLN